MLYSSFMVLVTLTIAIAGHSGNRIKQIKQLNTDKALFTPLFVVFKTKQNDHGERKADQTLQSLN